MTTALTGFQRQLLGKIPDAALAKRFGVSLHAIIRERNRHGIAPVRPWDRIVWTDSMLARLGQESDARLGAAWGLTAASVGAKRRALGIPVRAKSVAEIRWTPAMIADLARLSLPQFQQRYGVSEGYAQAERARRGISRGSSPANRTVWTPAMIARLGQEPDPVLAREWRMSPSTLGYKRYELGIAPYVQRHKQATWTPKMVADLAVLSIRAFVRKHRVHSRAVLIEREKRGIQTRTWHRTRITEEQQHLLGTMTDADFARIHGFDVNYVAGTRVRLGIASYRARRQVFPWTAYQIRCLGRFTDIALARRWKLAKNAVRMNRIAQGIRSCHWRATWTDAMRAVLPTMTITDAAQHLGLTIHHVAGERQRLGIRRVVRPPRRFTADEDRLLGTMRDADLARRLGRHPHAVTQRRRYLGIAGWDRAAPAETKSTVARRHRGRDHSTG